MVLLISHATVIPVDVSPVKTKHKSKRAGGAAMSSVISHLNKQQQAGSTFKSARTLFVMHLPRHSSL